MTEKERSICQTRDGAEHLCNAFLKLADVLPATDAEVFYGILVQKKGNFESLFTSYSSINDLRVLPSEQM